MYQSFKQKVADANNCNAMERETISKNRACPKSHTSKGNFMLKPLLFVLLVTMASGFSFVSCGDDEKEEKQEEVANLSVSTTNLNFSSGGESQTVYVTSNGSWSVTLKPDWCNVTSSSGSGSTTITVTATKNTATNSRTGNIELSQYKAGNSLYAAKKVTISVTQASSTSGGDNGGGTPIIPSVPTGVTAVVNNTSVNISWNMYNIIEK
jgi:hypothetical protein